MWLVFAVRGHVAGRRWLLARRGLHKYRAAARSRERRLPNVFVLVTVDFDDTHVLLTSLVRGRSARDRRVLAARGSRVRVVSRLYQLESNGLPVVASLEGRSSPADTRVVAIICLFIFVPTGNEVNGKGKFLCT